MIQLDHRVLDQISTRRIRVVKYRGSHHGTNEYPFLIDSDGLSVLPVTSLGLRHEASSERVSSGLAAVDEMLGGQGFYRGSTVLLSGTAGTGKTTLAAHFAHAVAERDERCLYFLFEESPQQMLRNMRSAGIDLQPGVDRGLLAVSRRSSEPFGLETHLVQMHRAVEQFQPDAVVVDPITNLLAVGTQFDVRAMLTRMIDFLKQRNITALFTSLTSAGTELEVTEAMISSLMDTWILTTAEEVERRRQRWLYVLKARGIAHSDEIRQFRFSDRGISLLPMPQGIGRRAIVMADEKFDLRLYVAGQTPKAARAFANLRKICEEHLAGRYTIEVVDLLEDPQLGKGDQILALPTLVRRLPRPIKKIIGDLSNTERVLVGLDLRPRGRE